MNKNIYTIGYAHHTQESFLTLLLKYHIQIVIDVRTMAYSAFHPQFNKEPFKQFLNSHHILYRQMEGAFGIIRPDSDLLNEAGYLDFTKIAQLESFKEGIATICRGIEKGYIIAFMCAEKAPSDCHRSTLVTRSLSERGYKVWHILSDGSLQSQTQLEQELVACYFPDQNQIDLFGVHENEAFLIDKAYELRSNQIASVNGKRVLKEKYEGK